MRSGELAIHVSLDALFRRNAQARPDALALADPVDRASFTDGAPLRLSYAEADVAIDRLARRLQSFGLGDRAVVAIQLPNMVEAVIALMAVLRAGLIAAPVPVLWRRSDLVAALAPLEVKAMLTTARLGNARPAEAMCEAAVDLFSLSFPCAFGADAPDGVISLDLSIAVPEMSTDFQPAPAAASPAVAIATFDAAPGGFYAVGRSHAEWIAAGLATLLEARIGTGDHIVSTLPPASLAGIGAGLVPWLLSGGALELVHGYLPVLAPAKGIRTHLLAPAAALPEIERRTKPSYASCIAVHRGIGTAALDFSAVPGETIVDLFAFGETGMIASARAETGRARPIPLGAVTAPANIAGAPVVIETRCDADGILALRGAMVPRQPFPIHTPADIPRLECDREGYVRTGYRCRSTPGGIVVDTGPVGIATIGGLRFGLDELSARVAKIVGAAKVAAIDDRRLGTRLSIEADDPAAAEALAAAGFSPLIVEAVAPQQSSRRAAG